MQDLIDSMPFARELGIEVTAATPEEVRGRLAWSERLCTAGGVMHGGVLMAFADTLGAGCAFLNLARPLHVGRSTIVIQTDLSDAGGRRVAQVTQTQAVIGPR